ncbi:hypothetical protein [Flavisolibacter tropicus]|uniref:Uncharacterized protein n=1 Tax=Flavisolibacter tropicus TaxID=1492898 RepID=A0A172U1W1_9BACT|nr:hypothetical protein [Flavisolibacter tropicus]ANE53013.1 hypothetical protein SY85_23605 [Flavisolibacter tropicus]
MEDNRNQNRNTDQQKDQRNIDSTTDASGLHVQHPPKGAEQMNKSFGKPDPDNLQYQSANLKEDKDRDSEAEKGHA